MVVFPWDDPNGRVVSLISRICVISCDGFYLFIYRILMSEFVNLTLKKTQPYFQNKKRPSFFIYHLQTEFEAFFLFYFATWFSGYAKHRINNWRNNNNNKNHDSEVVYGIGSLLSFSHFNGKRKLMSMIVVEEERKEWKANQMGDLPYCSPMRFIF